MGCRVLTARYEVSWIGVPPLTQPFDLLYHRVWRKSMISIPWFIFIVLTLVGIGMEIHPEHAVQEWKWFPLVWAFFALGMATRDMSK